MFRNLLKISSLQCRRSSTVSKINSFNKAHYVLLQKSSSSFKCLSCHYSDGKSTSDDFFHSFDDDKSSDNRRERTKPRTSNFDSELEPNSLNDYSDYDQNDNFKRSFRNGRRNDFQNDEFDDDNFERSFRNRRRNDFQNDEFDDNYRSNNWNRYSNRRDNHFERSYDRQMSHRSLGNRLRPKDWTPEQLQPIEKNFYVEHETVSAISESFLKDFYLKKNITVSGDKIKPIMDFHHANFPAPIITHMEKQRWTEPTLIQSIGWPLALSGKNMVGIAQTGSGKTLGFILPALVHIKNQRKTLRGDGPVALVLAPTRELAQQIEAAAREYGRLLGIRSLSIFGGASKNGQARGLSNSPELVIATPGRLLDFMESGFINFDRTSFAVLDEADRMLDMGFEPQIRKVLGQIRPDRQMLMWSATWPTEIQQLAYDYLGDFTQVKIGTGELTANPNITQEVVVCDRMDKLDLLKENLENFTGGTKTLIFTQTKATADFVERKLRYERFKVRAIHGDKSQRVRDQTLSSFRSGYTEILVATDVAARGLDVDDIKLVVNYDYPNTADDYIHRIGRTGRASKLGHAVTFVTDEDAGQMRDLIKVLKSADQEIPEDLMELSHRAGRSKKKKGNNRFNSYNNYNRRPSYNNYNRRPSQSRSNWDDFDRW